MTSINTGLHESENGISYLKKIQFIVGDENGISLITDEEGNDTIELNRECSIWLAKQILTMLKGDK